MPEPQGIIVLDQPEEIAEYRWRTLRAAVKLEALGLKKRGRSATVVARRELGLDRSATHADVLNAIEKKLTSLPRSRKLASL